ncbi:MAG TPA: FRG domain-containing protein [Clostridia bacterium]|nr:FRG domain-containing protein [Clostridia bacterium]
MKRRMVTCVDTISQKGVKYMEKLFKEKYTTVPTLMNELVRERRNVNLVFRGISRNDENKPKLQRVYNQNQKARDYSKFEFQMLHDFYRLGKPYFTVNYDVLDYVACAQHYGVPTRLIDWTRDPFVALFFAIYSNSSPNDNSYKIYYTDLSENTVINRIYFGKTWDELESGPEFILQYKAFLDMIQNPREFAEHLSFRKAAVAELRIVEDCEYHENGLLFFDPPMTNDRLIAQQGLFSIPISIENDDAEKDLHEKSNSFSIILDNKGREEMLNYLNNMNYTPTRLFPELESISRYVISKYEEDV